MSGERVRQVLQVLGSYRLFLTTEWRENGLEEAPRALPCLILVFMGPEERFSSGPWPFPGACSLLFLSVAGSQCSELKRRSSAHSKVEKGNDSRGFRGSSAEQRSSRLVTGVSRPSLRSGLAIARSHGHLRYF